MAQVAHIQKTWQRASAVNPKPLKGKSKNLGFLPRLHPPGGIPEGLLGFRVGGFRVLWFRVLGFWVLGFRASGFRVQGCNPDVR